MSHIPAKLTWPQLVRHKKESNKNQAHFFAPLQFNELQNITSNPWLKTNFGPQNGSPPKWASGNLQHSPQPHPVFIPHFDDFYVTTCSSATKTSQRQTHTHTQKFTHPCKHKKPHRMDWVRTVPPTSPPPAATWNNLRCGGHTRTQCHYQRNIRSVMITLEWPAVKVSYFKK